MKFGTGIIIFLVAIIALAAEFFLYIFFGLGAAFSGDLSTLSGLALFFFLLMILTAAVGILAPICALIETVIKKKNISLYIMLPILALILFGTFKSITESSKLQINQESITEDIHNIVEEPENKEIKTNIDMQKVEERSEKVKDGSKSSVALKQQEKENQKDIEKTYYQDKILVRNVKVSEALLGDYGVFGEIKNTGNKILTEVEITIYFLDKEDRPVYETTYHPVNVSSWSIIGDTDQPLKPNYGRKFGVSADEAPSDWAKKVRIEVTNIEFED